MPIRERTKVVSGRCKECGAPDIVRTLSLDTDFETLTFDKFCLRCGSEKVELGKGGRLARLKDDTSWLDRVFSTEKINPRVLTRLWDKLGGEDEALRE